MYCTRCGTANDEQATVCAQCKATLVRPGAAPAGPGQAIPNYLVQSILVTLCCCLVPGIVAIVYAAQVNALVAAGNFERARRCSRLACIWSWVGFGLTLLVAICYALILLLGAMLGRWNDL